MKTRAKKRVASITGLLELPNEVLHKILSILHESTGNEVFRCMQVCKRWRSAVPLVIRDVTLTMRSQSLQDFVQRGRYGNLVSLTLRQCRAAKNRQCRASASRWSPAFFETLGANFKHLTALYLIEIAEGVAGNHVKDTYTQTQQVHTPYYHTPPNPQDPKPIPKTSITEDCHAAPSHSSPLPAKWQIRPLFLTTHFSALFRHCPSLRNLHLDDCAADKLTFNDAPPLESLAIRRCPSLCFPSLSHLTPLTALSISTTRLSGPLACLEALTNLRSLEIPGLLNLDPAPRLAALPRLQTVHNGVSYFRSRPGRPSPLARPPPLLESLELHFSDHDPALALGHLSRLRRLRTSGAGVLRHGLPPSLEELSLLLSFSSEQDCASAFCALRPLTSLASLRLDIRTDFHELALQLLPTLRRLELRTERRQRVLCTRLSALADLVELSVTHIANTDEMGPPPPGLRKLEVHGTEAPALWPLDALARLAELRVYWCQRITGLPPLSALSRLTTLDVSYCERLEAMPSLEGLGSLLLLRMHRLNLRELPTLACLPRLEELDLDSVGAAWDTGEWPDVRGLGALRRLRIGNCGAEQLPPLGSLRALQVLELRYLDKLRTLPRLEDLTSLRQLELGMCPAICTLPPLSTLLSLRRLIVSHCNRLESVPPFQGLTQLLQLHLIGCPSLATIPSYRGHPDLEILHTET